MAGEGTYGAMDDRVARGVPDFISKCGGFFGTDEKDLEQEKHTYYSHSCHK